MMHTVPLVAHCRSHITITSFYLTMKKAFNEIGLVENQDFVSAQLVDHQYTSKGSSLWMKLEAHRRHHTFTRLWRVLTTISKSIGIHSRNESFSPQTIQLRVYKSRLQGRCTRLQRIAR
jgi:hypothetical protein